MLFCFRKIVVKALQVKENVPHFPQLQRAIFHVRLALVFCVSNLLTFDANKQDGCSRLQSKKCSQQLIWFGPGALLALGTCVSAALNKRQTARKWSSQSAAALYSASMCNHSERGLYQSCESNSLDSRDFSVQGKCWQCCPPCSNKHWHIKQSV